MTTDPTDGLTDSRLDPDAVADRLAAWLPGRRWFAGKHRGVGAVRARELARFGPAGATVQLWLADVTYTDGETDTYHVPLSVRAQIQDGLDHALIGELVRSDGQVLNVYDALWDRSLTSAWLRCLVDRQPPPGLEFHRLAEPDDIPVDLSSTVLTGEQSNTSLVYGDRAILKVFRRLEAGMNPDIEIHAALARTGGRHLADLLGYVQTTTPDGAPTSLAMLQRFMPAATDGWELAKVSVRDLMAEADLHAAEAGGDFAAEAYRLGVATAEVHADLAATLGVERLTGAQMSARAESMLAFLAGAEEVVPQLNEVGEQLRAAYQEFADGPPLLAQRIHGDLHLGQVLRTTHGWVMLDFEGEPARSIASRREPDSPLRDIAGMLRSFDYAANHQMIDTGSTPQTRYRAAQWSERNRDHFCSGYASVNGTDPRTMGVALRAFEADKAVYEAVYEARNRPAWLPVPLASLGRLVRQTDRVVYEESS